MGPAVLIEEGIRLQRQGALAEAADRFAQAGRAWGDQVDHLYPAYDFPFTYSRISDPIAEWASRKLAPFSTR